MRDWLLVSTFAWFLVQADAQSRSALVSRFGPPRSEIFALPSNVRLTVTFDATDHVCMYRIETSEHSERVSSSLTDPRFWIDSKYVTKLIADLVPSASRRGAVESRTVGLREGEHVLIEADESVQITRIQRSRRPLATPEVPSADRLVKILLKGTSCNPMAVAK